MRSRLPEGATLFTGDDYNYVGLIEGDGERHSDALLGAFAAVAPNASAAIQALDAGDAEAYRRILGPTEPLARHIFAAPTYYYKTGVAFLVLAQRPPAGVRHGRRPARGAQPAAPVDAACDWPTRRARWSVPDLAAERWNALLAVHGISAREAVRA